MNTIFQVLTLAWSVQGGVLPTFGTSDGTLDAVYSSPVLFAEYSFELSYPIFSGLKEDANGIYFGTTIRNQFVHGESMASFAPIQDTYTASAGVRWNELTIGFDHACTHSVENFAQSKIVSQNLFGDFDRIFIKLAGKI